MPPCLWVHQSDFNLQKMENSFWTASFFAITTMAHEYILRSKHKKIMFQVINTTIAFIIYASDAYWQLQQISRCFLFIIQKVDDMMTRDVILAREACFEMATFSKNNTFQELISTFH